MNTLQALLCSLPILFVSLNSAGADDINVNQVLAERLKAKGYKSFIEQAVDIVQLERAHYGGGGPYDVSAQVVKAELAGDVILDTVPERVTSEGLEIRNCASTPLERTEEFSYVVQTGNIVEIEDSINTKNTVSANVKGAWKGIEISGGASRDVVVNHREKGVRSDTISDAGQKQIKFSVSPFKINKVKGVRTIRKASVPFVTTVIVDGNLVYFYKGQAYYQGLISEHLSQEERTLRLRGSIRNVSASETTMERDETDCPASLSVAVESSPALTPSVLARYETSTSKENLALVDKVSPNLMVIPVSQALSPNFTVIPVSRVSATLSSSCQASNSNGDQRCSIECEAGKQASCADAQGSGTPICECK